MTRCTSAGWPAASATSCASTTRPGAKPVAVKLPFDGDIDALVADPRVPGVVFDTGAWTRFGGYYAYDPKSAKVIDTKLQPQGRYDNPTDLVSTEVKVKSHDGTLVPLSIVHKRGIKLDGTNPTILYGYGAYGISQTPFYRPQYLAWFERGGVFAVAHVRGGGENGEEWYKGGYQQTKPNTWRDAIACAEWLVAQRYTSPAKLAIQGGSQGGIYVGRSITERPDLFGAAIDQVPVSDAVRSSFETNGELDKTEMGTTETEAGFRALLAMSPVPPHPGRREVSGGHGRDRHQRPARRCVAGGEDGGTPPGGDGERQAGAAARRLRRRPRLRVDQEAAQRGARRHLRVPVLAVRREGIHAVAAAPDSPNASVALELRSPSGSGRVCVGLR